MDREEFENAVRNILDELPGQFGSKLDNVDIVIGDWPADEDLQSVGIPPGETLFGLYQGVPKTRRGHYNAVLPDRITIYRGPIVSFCRKDKDAIYRQIRKTLLHEIGHHFGMSEEDIARAQSG